MTGRLAVLGYTLVALQVLPIGLPTADAPPPTRIDTAYGYVEVEGNEVTVASLVEDPPKVRMVSPAGISLGALSYGRLRPDGRDEEMILIQGKQDERVRWDPRDFSGELVIQIRDGSLPDDGRETMATVAVLRHDGVWLKGISQGPMPLLGQVGR